jgi:hypothetical protein
MRPGHVASLSLMVAGTTSMLGTLLMASELVYDIHEDSAKILTPSGQVFLLGLSALLAGVAILVGGFIKWLTESLPPRQPHAAASYATQVPMQSQPRS